MSSFSKRPHRKSSGHSGRERAFDMPTEEDAADGTYITASYFDDDDDDDDIPDTRKTAKKKRQIVYEDDDDDYYGEKKKKPNIFVRAIHAIFPMKGDGVAESVRKVIFDIAVVAFVITGGSVVYNVIGEWVNQKIDIEISRKYKPDITTAADAGKEKLTPIELSGIVDLSVNEIERIVEEKPDIQPSFMELYAVNSDIVGWVKLGDENDPIVNIDYPVVQAEDNDYYLTHNFYKEDAQRGAIFADYRNKFDNGDLSGNTILYGHNMWNGDTMFAKLSRYYQPKESADPLKFYRDHPTVTFNTLYEDAQWKVFACVLFNTQEELGEVYPYLNYREFQNKETFNSFILDIMDRSVLWTDVDLTYGDDILTLSTCYYPYGKENADTRVAVFARKVREGESAEVDVSKAVRNYDPLKFRYQYERDGGSWGGRKWDSSKLLSYEG